MSDNEKAHPFDRAWAAGVFETRDPLRGRYRGIKNGNYIRIDSADEAMLKRFYQIVQVGKISSRQKEGVTRPYYRFETTAMDDARTLILTLAPFLSASHMVKASEFVARIERNDYWKKNNPDKKPVAHKMESQAREKE